MPPTPKDPLRAIKAGISRLKAEIKLRKDDPLARLGRHEKISDADEAWLDNEANLIDEEAVVELLEEASDYEHGLSQLSSHQKNLVDRLLVLGGGQEKIVGNKRK
ncbi:hypothetical protein C0992_009551, partial [Termitomyces sp. T32_za158]